MKICFITPWNRGGMIHYVSQLSSALSEKHKVYVLVPEGTSRDLFDSRVDVEEMPIPLRYFDKRVFGFKKITKKIDEINPDVIHITANHPILLFLIPLLRKRCVVSTLHDVEMHKGEWHPIWVLSLWLTEKRSKLIFVHGEYQKKKLASKNVDEQKIVVIPHGDYNFFTKFGDNDIPEESAILFFGRILEYKGLKYLLEAAPESIKAFPKTKIIIAGEGKMPDSPVFNKYPENFEICNRFILDKEIPAFFQRAAIVVLPYIEASQSGIIPVAYAFGKPVIASKVGCIPDVVEDNKTGILIEPKNPKAISSAVNKLLGDSGMRKTMGGNALEKNKELSWDKIAEKISRCYGDIKQ